MKEGWTYKKIKDVGEVIGGTTPSTNNPEFWGGNICWISPAELHGEHYVYDTVKKITPKAVAAKSLKELPEGTVILSSRAPIGKIAINKVPMYCNQGFKCVVCGPELFNEFLYWWFYGKKDYLNSLGTGAIFPEISKTVVENIVIPVAPMNEQLSIVSHLDAAFAHIDALKANAEKQLAETRQLFQAELAECMRPKEGWEEKRLGEVCTIARGGSPRPIKNYITNEPNGLNWIKIGDTDMGGKYIYSTKEKIKPEGLKKSRWVEEDEFLLSNSMSFGRPYILKTSGCIHDGWLVLRDYQYYLNIDFFYYVLSSEYIQKQFRTKAQGSTVSNLNTDRVASVSISVPPLSEQQSIVATLDSLKSKVDRLQENYEKISQECDALKQAMLREVFE